MIASTLSPGPGVRAASFRDDQRRVKKGDLIVAEISLVGVDAAEVLVSDATFALTIEAD